MTFDHKVKHHRIITVDRRCLMIEYRSHNETKFSAGCIYFIHGLGGSSKVWRYQIKYFYAKGYDIVAIDLPGHGNSPLPCPDDHMLKGDPAVSPSETCICQEPTGDNFRSAFTFDQFARDIVLVFDEFASRRKNEKRAMNIVVAHSYGTSIAVHLAHERSAQVQRLILISGGGPIPLYPKTWARLLPTVCISCFWPILVRQFQRKSFTKLDMHKSNKSTMVSRRKVGYELTGPKENTTDAPFSMDVCQSFDIQPHVLHAVLLGQFWPEGDFEYHSEVTVPTLLLHGDCDQFVELDEETEMLQALPAATLRVICQAGHMVMLEKPEIVNWHIENVIKNPPPFIRQPMSVPSDANRSAYLQQPSAFPVVDFNQPSPVTSGDGQELRLRPPHHMYY